MNGIKADWKRLDNALDGITAFLYQSAAHANGSNAALGRAEWWPKGHSFDPANAANIRNKASYVESIQVLSLPAPKRQASNRLPEFTRREIFNALVRAQDRATREAEARYPTDANKIPLEKIRTYDWKAALAANHEYEETLNTRYEKELLQKYKISQAELDAVRVEGVEQHWPLPAFGQ